MKTKTTLLIALFTAASFSLSAQGDSTFLNRAANLLSEHFNRHPVEKVYLHLDNYHYAPGDTVWFKAYVVAGKYHRLSALSGVLYAELIGKKDSLVKRLTLQLSNGLSYGDFILPDNYNAEKYRIRAYTNWMRNDGADYFYDQVINVGPQTASATGYGQNIAITNGKVQPKTQEHADVQFFPEGGDLVNGLRSKIAVKAVSPSGYGEDITGVILDNDNNVVATFSTRHLGMGAFALLPQSGKTYKAKITSRNSPAFTVDLPMAKDEGFTLTVNAVNADSIYVKVAANEQLFNRLKNSGFYVIGQQNGSLCFTAAAKLESPVFTAAIAKSRFKTGILQFTLFSADGEALNERVVFVQNTDQLNLALTAGTIHPSKGKLTFNLNACNNATEPVFGSFSVSVTRTNGDKSQLDDAGTPGIFTHLLLTSDLKGYVENPGYYFTNVNDKTLSDLDLLMLTQGYRKLLWKEVLNNTAPPVTYSAEKGLDMEGMVMTPSGLPVPNGKISVTSIMDRVVMDTLTGADGSFKFKNLAFTDTAKIIIKARKTNNGKNVAIYIKQHDYPRITQSQYDDRSLQAGSPDSTADFPSQAAPDSTAGEKMLKQVNIHARKTPKPDRFNGYGSVYEYDVSLGQLKDFAELKEGIAHKIPGVSLDGRGQLTYDRAVLTVMINGLRRDQDDLNIYSLSDMENIRLIAATLTSGPLLMATTHQFSARDSIHIKLKEVKIRDKRVEKPDKSNHFGTDAPYTITADRLKDMGPSLNPGLAAKIPGATYNNGYIRSIRPPSPLLHIVLDGHEIPQAEGSPNDQHLGPGGLTAEHNDINAYVNTEDVESIKVLHGMYYKIMYGIPYDPKMQDLDDIILITTKKFAGTAVDERLGLKEVNFKADPDATYVTSDIPTGLISYRFKGYSKAREFYSPKFDGPATPLRNDMRTTIYWEPGLITDKYGHASFEYFNPGNKGTYKVTIEGIDNNGNLGRLVYFYTAE